MEIILNRDTPNGILMWMDVITAASPKVKGFHHTPIGFSVSGVSSRPEAPWGSGGRAFDRLTQPHGPDSPPRGAEDAILRVRCSVDESQGLGEVLASIADAGFTHAEIRPRGWDIWLGGKGSREMARYASVLERFGDRLGYTLHGPYDINLFHDEQRHRRLLQASAEFAGAIGAAAIVVHPGRTGADA